MTTTWRPTRLSVASWATYDLANTIFALGIGSLYFPEWLTDNVAGLPDLLTGGEDADLALAVAIDAAMLIVIVLGPWIGARSDHRGPRSRFLVPATMLAVVPTFLLGTASVAWSLALFSVALVGFNLGSVVYDAMLPDVSTPETVGRVSGLGIAVGYVGSFVAVGVGELLLDTHGHPAVFRTIALLFMVFALPAFMFVRERPRPAAAGPPPALAGSLTRLVDAWRRTRRYRGVTRFLIGRFLYTDAVNTLIGGFLTIYVKEELDFTDGQIRTLLGVAIVGAMTGGLIGGRLVDRVGPRSLLHGALHTWMAAIVLGIVAGAVGYGPLAWMLGIMGGLALGATWAADRVYMARISPPRFLGEFYGLYATVGRFATILGPLVWGLTVTVAGLPREAALGVLVLFLGAARMVLGGVDDRRRTWTPADLGS